MSDLIRVFEFIHQAWGFSETVCLVWVIWAFIVFWTLRHEGDGRERFLSTIKKVSLGQFYRDQLGCFLDFTARSWFKDADAIADGRSRFKRRGSNKIVFGANALTEQAFVFSIKLALFYPILSVFLFWVISGTAGKPGGISILPELSFEMRMLFLVLMLFAIKAMHNAVNSRGKAVLMWTGSVFIVSVVFAFSSSFSGAFGVAFAFGFAFAMADVGIFAFAGAFDGSFAVAVTLYLIATFIS